MFRMSTIGRVRSCLSAERFFRPCVRTIERNNLPPCLLAQADGVARWLVVYHGVYQQFTCVDRTFRASLPDGVRLAIIVSPHGST
jgi:hypothetical protein